MRFLFTIVILLILSTFLSFVLIPDNPAHDFGDGQDLSTDELPGGYNDLFAGSGECLQCHNSQTNAQGESVAIVDDWRSTMMANAAKDPFWRAKVSHEGLVDPNHAAALEDICSRCHAPMGNFNAHHNGQALYSIEEMENDPLAMDGVSCTVCHQIAEETFGTYSANLIIGTEKKIWGPYETPFANPMINNTGYTPTYSEHIKDSQICGSCHTLITASVDLNGVPTGTDFVEQAVYHEWLNSSFSGTEATCQNCHMPQIEEPVKISSMPPWLDGREPFGMHHLVGANVFMLKLLKENIEALSIDASPVQMDSSINRAERMLTQNTLSFSLTEIDRTADTLYVEAFLQNMAGHKFPSGYPSRRVFIELIATTESGDDFFHSGQMDENYDLVFENDTYEPHHQQINQPEQTQLYELVMGNVIGEVTTILEQAYEPLKDNRIAPQGFSINHFCYDTVAIVGNAFSDSDFNHENGVEGSGSDRLVYALAIPGNAGSINVTAKVHYQTVSAKWLEHMFGYSSDEIDTFKEMYENADKEPVMVADASLISLPTDIRVNTESAINISPNPAGSNFRISGITSFEQLEIYTLSGQLLQRTEEVNREGSTIIINSPKYHGSVLVKISLLSGEIISRKLVVYND